MDMWLVGVLMLGTASTAGAINFLVTIFKLRAPGMTMFRLPLFTWTTLVTALLTLLATPVLASALILLFADRNGAQGAFFDPTGAGGQSLLWQNMFWFYSHPAVYIMVLPAFGAISEVIPVFSRKPLFGYRSMVLAVVAIGLLGFIVWAHHMFTTGGVFLPFFMASTFLIAVPTGVKMFNWMATMYRGSLQFTTAMLFAVGFLMVFLIGGITGVFHAAVPVDFALHDTYFVVSHLHYVLVGGSAFGILAGTYYWFPKMFRAAAERRAGQTALRPHVRGDESDLLAPTDAGAGRDAAADQRLRGQRRLGVDEHDCDHRRLHGGGGADDLYRQHSLFHETGRESRRQPLGRQHAGMGHEFTAAAAQLRFAAGDSLGAAAVRSEGRGARRRRGRGPGGGRRADQ